MSSLQDLLKKVVQEHASDLHLNAGFSPQIRIQGELKLLDPNPLTAENVKELCYPFLSEKQITQIETEKELDTSFGIKELGRFRLNLYWQRGSLGAAIRYLPFVIPSCEELGVPETVIEMAMQNSGLLIISGAVSTGKSTTLAALIQRIAKTRPMKIVTIEDPIEYLHRHRSATIIQREVGVDTLSPRLAMRSLFRQDPDVIMIGEMRDLETVHTALTLAQTGQLVLATLHNTDALQAINRIVDVFPAEQQDQVRLQLSLVLVGIVVQQLVPAADKKNRVLALEILKNTPAVQNLIRKNEIPQILSVMQTGGEHGMATMEKSLSSLYATEVISRQEYESRSRIPSPLTAMKTNRRGMTLVELLIASLLLGWFIAGMMSLYRLAQRTMTRTQQIQYASFLAREKLEELAGVGFQKLTQSPYNFDASRLDEQIRTESQSDIENSFPPGDVSEFIKRHLVWRITKLQNRDDWIPGGSIDYRKIEVTVDWNEQPS